MTPQEKLLFFRIVFNLYIKEQFTDYGFGHIAGINGANS